ncbi:Uncharacterised protein [Streptococcus pneumoniae]|nr:Uncharacterised protein [Streptococcus pneumoniae]
MEVEFVSCICKESFGNGVDTIDNIICFHASIITQNPVLQRDFLYSRISKPSLTANGSFSLMRS